MTSPLERRLAAIERVAGLGNTFNVQPLAEWPDAALAEVIAGEPAAIRAWLASATDEELLGSVKL